nr:phytanoyl-CoA dioxygenase family protein [Oscillatoria laete-virens]
MPAEVGKVTSMLTQDQIDQFHRDGFLVVRNVIKGRELTLLQEAADQVEADGIARNGNHHMYREIEGVDTYFRTEFMWEKNDIFRAVTVNPALLAIAGQCIGHPFLPLNDSFVCKSPRSKVPVEWHQDPPYIDPSFQETYPVPHFDIDIYIDDSTIENACLWGIPGTHLVGHIDHKRFSEEEMFRDFGAVPLEMKAGDILLHTFSFLHGSAGNLSDKKDGFLHLLWPERRHGALLQQMDSPEAWRLQ